MKNTFLLKHRNNLDGTNYFFQILSYIVYKVIPR
jgi:hypothetical protein